MVNAAIFAGLAVLVGGWLLWHSSRDSYVTCGLFALLLIASAGLGLTSLGNPKPMSLEWPRPTEAKVAAYILDEPNAIYIWVLTDSAPRAFVLPWSMPTAESLNAAGEQAKEQGTGVMMQMSKATGLEGTPSTEAPMFYAAPQQPLPFKASPQ